MRGFILDMLPELAAGHPGKALRQAGSRGEEPRAWGRLFSVLYTQGQLGRWEWGRWRDGEPRKGRGLGLNSEECWPEGRKAA